MGLVALLALGAAMTLAAAVTAVVRDARFPARASVGWALARRIPTRPAEAGMDSTDGSVVCPDGTALPLWTVRGGSPEGPALLLLHGWRRSRIDSLRRLPWLLPHVRFACLMDLRGHGDAPRGPSTLGAADVDDACTAARAHAGIPWIVAGHSLGASVAMRASAAMLRAGVRVEGVLLMSPYPNLRVPLSGRLSSVGMPAFPLAGLSARAIAALSGRESPIGEAIEVVARASVPTVWVTCAEDAIVSPDAVRGLHAQALDLGSPATLHVDADADHDSLGTGEPPWAAAAIAALTPRRAAATRP